MTGVMTECDICVERFNRKLNKKIECPSCQKSACSKCVRVYLADTLQDPHCMFCKNVWSLFFLNTNLPHSFMSKEWKQKRSQVLYVREQSYFHSTMVEIEKIQRIEDLERKKMDILDQIEHLKSLASGIDGQIYQLRFNSETPKTETHDGFSILACSVSGCNGFLEKRKGVCMLCQKKTCLSCNVECMEGHTCHEEDVNTWTEIKRNSKPCPNCATRISKTYGCSQMWCPNCHKAFNWNTGKIETGIIHNPHYFQFLDRNPEYRQEQQDRNVC